MRKNKKSAIKSNVLSPVKVDMNGRKKRDRKTFVISPIRGTSTKSKQWSRSEGWTP